MKKKRIFRLIGILIIRVADNNSEDNDVLSSSVADKEDDNLNNNPGEHLTASNTSKPTTNIELPQVRKGD